jgi:hypothetical protein
MQDEMLSQLMNAMMAQSAMVAAAAQPPPTPTLPPIYETPEIDWEDEIARLNRKAKGNAAADVLRKKGVLDTIGTGSLLAEEEEPATTESSLLIGVV